MPIGSVSAYQAALESTNTELSYAMESAWATLPATPFQSMRVLSDSLAHKKTRTMPGEVRGDRQTPAGLTTNETASGSIVFPTYFSSDGRSSPFEDFLTSSLGGDWQPITKITGIGGDIALGADGGLSSPTANKFAGVVVGQTVKLNGFANTVNNGFFRVVSVTDSSHLVTKAVGFVPAAETPAGTAATVTFSCLKNGLFFKSMYVQHRLDPKPGTKFFRYPGSYATSASMTLSLGQFMQATFNMTAQQELRAIVDASTGNVVPAPETRDFDPVGGFKGIFFNDLPLGTGADSTGIDFTNTGAAGENFLGSPLAQGMLGGTFMASAKASIAFRDFTLYDSFRSENKGVFSQHFGDQAGNRYVVTIPQALPLFDSGVAMTGPNKMMTAPITVEAAPDTAAGCTVIVDRIPAGA